jgi:hypothetical protein
VTREAAVRCVHTLLALAGLAACDSRGSVLSAASGSPTDASVGAEADATSDGPASRTSNCQDAGTPPASLECTGLYADFATKRLAAGALPYAPASSLWSDGAQKARWIVLPAGARIDATDPSEWTFPVGTQLFKEFRVAGKRVETRMFQKVSATFWTYATYAWNADDSQAPISFGGPVAVGDRTWNIPSNEDCDECHRGRRDRILGFDEVGLGLPGAQGLTLAQLRDMGLITPVLSSTSLSIGDDGTGLDSLAMAWLHVNCGVTCHNANPTAAGYGAGMRLRLDPAQLDGTPPDASTWDILKTTLNVACVSGSLAGQPRIVPGDVVDSVVHKLIDERGALQMPPIASLEIDTADVAVVAAWIGALGKPSDGGVPEGGPYADGGDGSAPEAGADATAIESGASDDGGSEDAGTSSADD